LVAISVAGPAFAAQQASGDDGSLQIRQVDARDADAVAVDFSWTGEPAAVEGLTIAEGGEEVDHEPATPDVPPMAIVLAVDVSEAMEGTALVQTKAALTEWLAVRPEGSRVALVTFNDEARIVVDFTTDTASLQAAIDELTGSGATALWNGVVTAAESFETVPDLQHNIVLVSGAPDSASTATPSAARGAVTGQDASVYAIGTGGSETASLQSLVSAAGGTLASTDEAGIPAAVDEAGLALAQQYQVVFARSDPEQNVAALELQIGDASAEASFVSGGVIEGGSRLAPKPASEPEGFAPLQGNSGKMMAILATLVAVSLGVYALVMALSKDPSGLQSVLSPYGEGYSGGEGGEGEEVEGDSALAKNAIIQRAVDMTENFAEKQGFLAKAEGALERANLPLRAAEAMFFYAAFVVVVTLLGIILKGILVGLIVALIAGLAGPASVNFIAKRRRKKFVSQLPDTLSLLSGTLRAGYSLMQGVEAVAQEVDEPMGMELRRVCTEARLGRPLEEALDASADRMDSPDFSWAVMAISIQREVGGNLSELLLTVADTMTQRERLRRDVAALTAEGKISAIVLGILPPALAVVMWVVNPEYIGLLFNTTIGNVMLGAATLLALFGFWWMKKCVEIEI
jgi:tight adherence protein B